MKRVFAFIGFTVAVTLIILNIISFTYSVLILLISAVIFVSSLLIKKSRQAAVLPAVFGSIVFACLIFITVFTTSVEPVKTLDGETVKTEFQIIDIPDYSVDSDCYSYIVKAKGVNINGVPSEIKVKLKSSDKLDYDYYDVITADLCYYSSCDSAFDSYGMYSEGVYISAKLKTVYGCEAVESKPVNYYLINLRLKIFDLINSEFRGNTAGLTIALLTGDKSFLSTKAESNIRCCGLSHYLAVSGFHISLVCMLLYSLLKLLKAPKVVNTVITLAVVLAYCGIADFSSSAVRSCIMIAVMLAGDLFNTKSDSLNSLGFAVFLICLNPFAVSDPSAFLSVSAMLGIFVVFRNVKAEFKVKNRLDESVLLTICVLLSTVVGAYIFFGNISVGSVFLNLFVEPIFVIIIICSFLFCMLFSVAPLNSLLSEIINSLTKLLLNVFEYVSDNFSSMYSSISSEIFGFSLAGIFLFMGICMLVKKKIPVKATAAFTAVMLVIGALGTAYGQNFYTNVYVTDGSMVIVYDRDSAVVVGMDTAYDETTADTITNNKNTVYIDCDNYFEDINIEDEYVGSVDNIGISVSDEIITLNVYDKVLEIDEDCVIINGYSFDRYSYYSQGASYDTVISFTKNSQLSVRRDGSG